MSPENRKLKVETDFEEMHIAWVWEELRERYGFPLKEWKKRFAEHLAKQHPLSFSVFK